MLSAAVRLRRVASPRLRATNWRRKRIQVLRWSITSNTVYDALVNRKNGSELVSHLCNQQSWIIILFLDLSLKDSDNLNANVF